MKNRIIPVAVIISVLAIGGFTAKNRIGSSKPTNQILGEKQEQIAQPSSTPIPTQIYTPSPNIENEKIQEIKKAVQNKLTKVNETKEETNNNIIESPSSFTPTLVETYPSEHYPQTTESPTPTISIEQQKATKIVSISDSLGNTFETNCHWSSTHYECPPKDQSETVVSIKSTPQLTFTINAQDPNNRPLTYHYYYAEGCRGEGTNWISSNSCTSILKTNELGLRTFSFYVKNDDNYGSVGLDANTSLYYRIVE